MGDTYLIGRAWSEAAHPRAPAGATGGGQFAPASQGSGQAKGKQAKAKKDTRATPSNEHPVGEGETGKRVSDLQARLNALGFKPPLKVDGIFGPKTLAAVRAFQKSHGLKVDGLVGPKTTAALRAKTPAKPAAKPALKHLAKVPAKTLPAKTVAAKEALAKTAAAAPAKTAARAIAHEKVGHTGQGLWHSKNRQLPAYIQHIANDLIQGGMDESTAIATAVAQCKKWAAGGEGVKPETRAKAAAAVAEWERLKAGANAKRSTLVTSDGEQDGGSMRRSYDEWIRPTIPLEDIRIVSRAEGDAAGTLVEAYATVFDEPAEIKDSQGHYKEIIDRTAFDHELSRIRRSRGGFAANVKVLYNHGKTMEGMPAPEFQLPLGVPEDIRPETRGLLTRTRFDTDDPFTDRVLSKVRAGAITSYSFVGGIMRSTPELEGPGRKYRARNGALTTVRRMMLGLREYGPVLFPAYTGAEILGVRMSLPGATLDDVEGEPDSTGDEEYAPDADDAAEDVAGGTPEEVHPSRDHAHRLLVMRTEQMFREAGIKPLKGGF